MGAARRSARLRARKLESTLCAAECQSLWCLVDVRNFGGADQVGAFLVFDIKGNTYRLIVTVVWADQHQGGRLFGKHFLTHAEYDKDTWKDCGDLRLPPLKPTHRFL